MLLIESIVHHPQPTFLNLRTREMPPMHEPKSDSLPRTNSGLQIGFMPGRPRRLSPRQPTVPRIKQSPRAPHSNNYSVDRYHRWMTQKRRLRTFDDRQHNLVEEARLYTTHYLSNEIREYSQWFRGATSPTPSPGTTTEQTTNSPKSSAHTAPLSFHSTSKLFHCQIRSSHG